MAIVWEDGAYTSSFGMVGRLRLFTITYGVTRRDDNRSWKLRTGLPMRLSEENWESQEGARQAAEGYLDQFMGHIEKYRGKPA